MKPHLFKLVYLISFLLYSNAGRSQNWEWAKSQSTPSYVAALCVDFNENIIIAGSNSILKYDPQGEEIWQTSWNGKSTVFDMKTDSQGNIYVIGAYESTLYIEGATLLLEGYADMFLLKYGPDKKLLLAKKAGGRSDQVGKSLVLDKEGNIYVTGEFYGLIDFGGLILSSKQTRNMFVAKYNSSGIIQWAKTSNGTSINQGSKIVVDIHGNPIVIGNYFDASNISFGSIKLQNKGFTDCFIVKYDDLTGNELYAIDISGLKNEYFSQIITDNNGNIFIAGSFNSPELSIGNTTLKAETDKEDDVFVSSLDSNGQTLWIKKISGVRNDAVTSLNFSYNNNLFLTAMTYSPKVALAVNDTISFKYFSSIFFVNLDKNGVVQGKDLIESQNPVNLSKVVSATNGDIIMAGNFTSSLNLGGITLSGANSNIFFGKYAPLITGFKEPFITSHIPVYPNPINSGRVNFGRIVEDYKLCNSNGHVVIKGNKENGFEVNNLPKGMYFLLLDGVNEKIVIQ